MLERYEPTENEILLSYILIILSVMEMRLIILKMKPTGYIEAIWTRIQHNELICGLLGNSMQNSSGSTL